MTDWSKHEGQPEMTCTCVADHVFRSHATYVPGQGLTSRKPCPQCGETRLTRARSDPEKQTL